MKPEITCPLGAKCEEIKDNRLLRCGWYVNVRGKMPHSEEIIDQWGCSMYWTPLLIAQSDQTNRGQTAAIESFRNETCAGQAQLNRILLAAASTKGAVCISE